MAINQEFTNLINADIDGEISAADKPELQAFLAQNDEGRAFHEDLSSLCSTLDTMEALEPPTHLRHVIMSSVPRGAEIPERPSFLRTLFAAPALTHAATFAAGILIALSILNTEQFSNQTFDDLTGLVGTVADPVDSHVLDAIAFDKPEIAGRVSLRTSGDMLILDFDLVAQAPIEIEAAYTDRNIWFNGFGQRPESDSTTVSAKAGQVRLTVQGKRRYAVYLHNAKGNDTSVTLRFLQKDNIVHEAGLSNRRRK